MKKGIVMKKMKNWDFEKICSIACYTVGLVFFFIALFGVWPHFFTMSICFATGFLASENQTSRTP